MKGVRGALVAALAGAVLAGCSRGEPWETMDISGMMPELEFTLVDEDGEPVRAERFRGRVVLMFFGYTSCPDVCPTTLARLTDVLGELDPEARRRVDVLFVSVDPERDTPARLAAYTDAFGDGIVGLTGDQEALRDLNRRYRVTYGYGEPDAEGNYEVSHSGAVFAFDAEGDARLLIRGSDGREALVSDLRRLVRTAG